MSAPNRAGSRFHPAASVPLVVWLLVNHGPRRGIEREAHPVVGYVTEIEDDGHTVTRPAIQPADRGEQDPITRTVRDYIADDGESIVVLGILPAGTEPTAQEWALADDVLRGGR